MTIIINAATAAITTESTGAAPAIAGDQMNGPNDQAVLHLTRNKGPVLNGTAEQNPAAASAINIKGAVAASIGPRDNLGTWSIHFIQLIYEPLVVLYYAGPTNAEGSIIYDLAEPTPQFMLDSDAAAAPFTNTAMPTAVQVFGGLTLISTSMDDHPYITVPLSMPNFVNHNKMNYLIRARRSLHFYTAFVARDNFAAGGGSFSILAHVYWTATWDCSVQYRLATGDVFFSTPAQSFLVGTPVKGAPKDSGLANMIVGASANDPMYNATSNKAKAAAYGSTSNNRRARAFPHWDASMNPAGQFLP